MDRRLKFHQILVDILGSENVYFQPPETVSMNYPCIVYSRQSGDSQYADDSTHVFMISYSVTMISRDPDLQTYIIRELAKLPMSRYDRHYTKDNLHHDNFVIYF
jgi:hypothetical protein